MKRNLTLQITYSAICLSLCMVLPLLTGQIPQIGKMLCPMHIPVLLCGFLCGWQWGLPVGFIAPLLRALIFGQPPIFPTATAMAFELAAYGAVSGLLYNLLPKKRVYIYVALGASMLIGRVVWGFVMWACMGISASQFTFALFFAGAFTDALLGIVLQIVLIPLIIMALQAARLMPNQKEQ